MLAMRYVDEVIIGAPWEVTKQMINTFNIKVSRENIGMELSGFYWLLGFGIYFQIVAESDKHREFRIKMTDQFKVPKEMGIYQQINCTIFKTTE